MSAKIDRRHLFLLAGSGMVSMGSVFQGGLSARCLEKSCHRYRGDRVENFRASPNAAYGNGVGGSISR